MMMRLQRGGELESVSMAQSLQRYAVLTQQDYGNGNQNHQNVMISQERDHPLNANGEWHVGHGW